MTKSIYAVTRSGFSVVQLCVELPLYLVIIITYYYIDLSWYIFIISRSASSVSRTLRFTLPHVYILVK